MGKPKNNAADEARNRCQTPAYALEPLRPYLDALQQQLGRRLKVWESAAGEGYLVRALEACGYDVIATDVLGGYNRFAFQPERYDVEVTNVPFSIKYRWLRASSAAPQPFALLMPSDALFAGQEAQPLIAEHDIKLLIPNQRIDFKMPNKGWGLEKGAKGTAQMNTSWFTKGLGVQERATFVDIRAAKARWISEMRDRLVEDAGQRRLFEPSAALV